MNKYLMKIQSFFGGYKEFEIEAENKQDSLVKAREYCRKHPEYGHGGNYKLDSITCIKKLKKIIIGVDTMSTTPTYNDRQIRRILWNNGFVFNRCRGSHKTYKNVIDGRSITIRCNNQNKMVMQRLIKEYNLVIDTK